MQISAFFLQNKSNILKFGNRQLSYEFFVNYLHFSIYMSLFLWSIHKLITSIFLQCVSNFFKMVKFEFKEPKDL